MSQNKITVSIVVPVYNTVKYLSECFDSLINQTLRNFEIIIIDDGSDDGSENICMEYAEKHKNIKLVRQKNAGVTNALRHGMKFVQGKYFTFCGSDDFVSHDFYKNLYNEAEKTNADITQCGFALFYAPDDIVYHTEERIKKVIMHKKGKASELMDVMLFSPSLTVRRLHKTNVIRKYNIKFEPDIHMAEDLLFHIETLLVAEKFAFIEQTGYFYRQNRENRQSLVGDKRLLDFFKIFDKAKEFIDHYNIKNSRGIVHLKINILIQQLKRVNPENFQDYMNNLLHEISIPNIIHYGLEGFIFSIKTYFVKYFILNCCCSFLLLNIFIFKKNYNIAKFLLNTILCLQQGGILKRLLHIK